MKTETLFTQRLILRRLCPEDAAALHRNCSSDEETVRYLERSVSPSPEFTASLVSQWISAYETDDFFLWAIEFEGEIIGTINLHDVCRAEGTCEIGFSIGSRWWNRGIMTEAVRAVISHALNKLALQEITGWCAPGNVASARVMRKAGMHPTGLARRAVRLNSGEEIDPIRFVIHKPEQEVNP